MPKVIFISAFFLILSAAGALASENAVTLKQALELGLRENPGLKAAASSAEASGENIGIARSALLPKIALEERFMKTNNPTFAFSSRLNQGRFSQEDFDITSLNGPDAINDFQTSISFEQPLYSRSAGVGLRMAKKEYSAARDGLRRSREALAFEIGTTYLLVNTARGFARVAEQGLEDAREHLRLAEARYGSGLGLLSDVLRAETGVVEAEQRLVTAGREFRTAKMALALLLGLDGEADTAGEIEPPALKELDYYIAASARRSDIISMSRRRDNARNAVELARSGYYPTIGAGGAYFLNDHQAPFGGEGQSWQFSVFLRWNIFDGTLRSHESKKAAHLANEAAHRLDGLRKAAAFSVREAWLRVEEAGKNLELSEAALRSAEEGERLVRLRYENSLSPIIDLIDARLGLEGARADLVMRRNALSTALLSLAFQAGTLLEDLREE